MIRNSFIKFRQSQLTHDDNDKKKRVTMNPIKTVAWMYRWSCAARYSEIRPIKTMRGTPTIRCSNKVITSQGMIRQDLRQHAPAIRKMLSGTFAHPIMNEKNAIQGVIFSVSSNNWNMASLKWKCLENYSIYLNQSFYIENNFQWNRYSFFKMTYKKFNNLA